jgi:hypothetical protein
MGTTAPPRVVSGVTAWSLVLIADLLRAFPHCERA